MIPDAPPRLKIKVRRDGSVTMPWTVTVHGPGQHDVFFASTFGVAIGMARFWMGPQP